MLRWTSPRNQCSPYRSFSIVSVSRKVEHDSSSRDMRRCHSTRRSTTSSTGLSGQNRNVTGYGKIEMSHSGWGPGSAQASAASRSGARPPPNG